MKTKKDKLYSFDHTRKRLAERYGIEIQSIDYTELCSRINKKKDVKFVSEEKQKKDIQQIYDITFRGATVRVVWSMANRYIKTVLPI